MLPNDTSTYLLSEHRHRFAAWCAATAASRSPKCRFPVQTGTTIIEASGLKALAQGWDAVPAADEFDVWHRKTILSMQSAARTLGFSTEVDGASARKSGKCFTYGVAAKLLSCYLKPLYGVALADALTPIQSAKQNAIHPPIDRLLAKALLANDDSKVSKHADVWRLVIKNGGWSALGEAEYGRIIDAIKDVTDGALWKIESYWRGFQ